MKRNVGNVDRVFRLIAGTLILAAGYYEQTPWGLLGFVPYFTIALGWCPLYSVLGISTREVRG
ncbi:MAG: DUF2892 domain-containing protein [Deltaproteobacteria bacterium]|nr:DUF2892 domain-containing protein [Deltaproteobacteria bacterium]